MPSGDVQNYSGGWTGVDHIGSPVEKIQVYNGTGSDLANGAVVRILWQADGTSGIGPTVGTPASSSSVVWEFGVVDNVDNPDDGTALYAGIKSTHTGWVRIYGYCAVVTCRAASTAGNMLLAYNGETNAADAGDSTETAATFGVVITGHASTAGNTDAFIFKNKISVA